MPVHPKSEIPFKLYKEDEIDIEKKWKKLTKPIKISSK